MESSLPYDSRSLPSLETGVQPEVLAKAQWTLISTLENQYHGKTVFGSKNKFEDSVWFSDNKFKDNPRIYWDTFSRGCGVALSILVKIICFEMIVTNRLEPLSVKFKLQAQRNSIIGLIQTKKLLGGDRGSCCLGLSHITDDDLLAMIDARLVSASSEAAFAQECCEIGQFISLANHLSEMVPLFELNAKLPWDKAGIGIKKWVKRRAADLDEVFRIGEGYGPLDPECVTQIIERSLHLVLEQSDHISELARMLRCYKHGEVNTAPPAKQLLDTYGPIFGDVAEPPNIENLSSSSSKIIAIFIWIRQLVYLARGACINIILLTSGLRNSDIRDLRVGACRPSGRIDMLFYLQAKVKKTKNLVIVPVPSQTQRAVILLEKIKFGDSNYLVDGKRFSKQTYNPKMPEEDARIATRDSLNFIIRDFAEHFNIPFVCSKTGELYSAHNYRTTVAGWLDAHSNLSVLLVRRLFGHSNDVMPTTYLRNNPSFIQERKEQKERAAAETARQMALAASQGRLAGIKGEQLLRGYQSHVSRLQADPKKSHSLTDAELFLSFAQLVEQRILDESVCGFLTPFGVRCMRNPSDSSQPPCARRSHRDKTREIAEEILQHINDIDPQNCIGTSCDQALLGPWSESILKTLVWLAGLLRHQHGDRFTDEHFRQHAISFVRQYGPQIKKVFKVEVSPDGSVKYGDVGNGGDVDA